jgi:hypothetical protein
MARMLETKGDYLVWSPTHYRSREAHEEILGSLRRVQSWAGGCTLISKYSDAIELTNGSRIIFIDDSVLS